VSIRTALPADEPSQWAAPAHFSFQGNTYFYRGSTVYELPEGCQYAGETTREPFSDSNIDGAVFADAENPENVYFRWPTWETTDGPEPFLCFRIDD
jgi:hypothetical protein